MPKNLIDYSNTIIYKICCKDKTVKELYVGHTTNFVKRKNMHKAACNNETNPQYNSLLYKKIRENGGWDNWEMIEIEICSCENSTEARIKEQYYYEELKAKLNSISPYLDPKNSFCNICNKQYTNYEYQRHLNSKLHKSKETSGNNFVLENQKNFKCILCDYFTSSSKDLNKHYMTAKHKKRENGNFLEMEETEKIPSFECINCSKNFSSKSGLWKHRQKCHSFCQEDDNVNKKHITEIKNTDNDVKMLTNMVLEVVKQNQELILQNSESQKYNQELTNKLYEICKNGTNNTLINNNSHNKTFNLQFFLNEKCKDAMNIMDFVNSMTLELSDLEDVGTLGYVEGISNIIIRKLGELDIYKRPIHCSDGKREIMYVKDDNVWEKENDTNDKLRLAIKHVTYKNSSLLVPWSQKHPNCMNTQHHLNDVYVKMIGQAMGGKGEFVDSENKIMKKIAKSVLIDKTC
jgi:hypothetical protein